MKRRVDRLEKTKNIKFDADAVIQKPVTKAI